MFQEKDMHAFFISNAFFSTQSQCCLSFWWIEPQMLLRFCLIHQSIIILRHFFYLLYLCPCRIYMIYFSFSSSFSLWLIVSSHEYRHKCSFALFLEYILFLDNNRDGNNFQREVQCQGVAWHLLGFLTVSDWRGL